MISKKERIVECTHCRKEFRIVRTGHRFCSNSCRVASHQMEKRSANAQKNEPQLFQPDSVGFPNQIQPPAPKHEFLINVAGTTVSLAIMEAIKKFMGMSTGDIMMQIKKMEQDQLNFQNETRLKEQKMLEILVKLANKEGITVTILNQRPNLFDELARRQIWKTELGK